MQTTNIINHFDLDVDEITEIIVNSNIHVESDFSTNTLTYIAGYTQRQLMKVEKCSSCISYLKKEGEKTTSPFLDLKNEGGRIQPVKEVNNIVKETEIILQLYMRKKTFLYKKNIIPKISSCVTKSLIEKKPYFLSCLDDHYSLSFEHNHRFKMIKKVCQIFLALRLKHLAKEKRSSLSKKKVRRTLTKLILFKNQ